jgi:hypothetical protein
MAIGFFKNKKVIDIFEMQNAKCKMQNAKCKIGPTVKKSACG